MENSLLSGFSYEKQPHRDDKFMFPDYFFPSIGEKIPLSRFNDIQIT